MADNRNKNLLDKGKKLLDKGVSKSRSWLGKKKKNTDNSEKGVTDTSEVIEASVDTADANMNNYQAGSDSWSDDQEEDTEERRQRLFNNLSLAVGKNKNLTSSTTVQSPTLVNSNEPPKPKPLPVISNRSQVITSPTAASTTQFISPSEEEDSVERWLAAQSDNKNLAYNTEVQSPMLVNIIEQPQPKALPMIPDYPRDLPPPLEIAVQETTNAEIINNVTTPQVITPKTATGTTQVISAKLTESGPKMTFDDQLAAVLAKRKKSLELELENKSGEKEVKIEKQVPVSIQRQTPIVSENKYDHGTGNMSGEDIFPLRKETIYEEMTYIPLEEKAIQQVITEGRTSNNQSLPYTHVPVAKPKVSKLSLFSCCCGDVENSEDDTDRLISGKNRSIQRY